MSQSLAVFPAVANQVIGQAVDPSMLCLAAVNFAEQTEGLPHGILRAIGVVESGRPNPGTGSVQPWPWTINANGVGHVYDSEEEALAAAHAFQNAGVNSLDIGCLQVNLRQHPLAFAGLDHAFSPAENAFYAGRFLSELKAKLGSWPAAIAAYHSQTPSLGIPYEQRVLAVWQQSGDAPQLALAASPVLPQETAQAPSRQVIVPIKPNAQPKHVKPPPSSFGAGSFQFLGLRNRMPVTQVMAQAASPVRPAGGVPMRGLAAYRAAPIPIAMVR